MAFFSRFFKGGRSKYQFSAKILGEAKFFARNYPRMKYASNLKHDPSKWDSLLYIYIWCLRVNRSYNSKCVSDQIPKTRLNLKILLPLMFAINTSTLNTPSCVQLLSNGAAVAKLPIKRYVAPPLNKSISFIRLVELFGRQAPNKKLIYVFLLCS